MSFVTTDNDKTCVENMRNAEQAKQAAARKAEAKSASPSKKGGSKKGPTKTKK